MDSSPIAMMFLRESLDERFEAMDELQTVELKQQSTTDGLQLTYHFECSDGTDCELVIRSYSRAVEFVSDELDVDEMIDKDDGFDPDSSGLIDLLVDAGDRVADQVHNWVTPNRKNEKQNKTTGLSP